MYTDYEIALREQVGYLKEVIYMQKELLDVQRDLIKLLMSGEYKPDVPEPVDPYKWDPCKWKYNPGPTCDCMKGEDE